MQKKHKNPLIPLFAVMNLAVLLTFFIPYYIFELDRSSEIVAYIVSYVQELYLWALPALAAVSLLHHYSESDMKSALLTAIPLEATALIYTIPYYYLHGISGGLDSLESILFSLLTSVVYIVTLYLHSFILFFVAKWTMASAIVSELVAKLPPSLQNPLSKETKSELYKKAPALFSEKLKEDKHFDLSAPVARSLFAISFTEFLIHLVEEIHTASSYLIDYAGSYRIGEIIYMVFRFMFIMALLFLMQEVCHRVKKHLVRKHEEAESKTESAAT